MLVKIDSAKITSAVREGNLGCSDHGMAGEGCSFFGGEVMLRFLWGWDARDMSAMFVMPIRLSNKPLPRR